MRRLYEEKKNVLQIFSVIFNTDFWFMHINVNVVQHHFSVPGNSLFKFVEDLGGRERRVGKMKTNIFLNACFIFGALLKEG